MEQELNSYITMLKHFDPDYRINGVRALSEFYLNDDKRKLMNQIEKNKIIEGLLSKLETSESEGVKSKIKK